MRMNRVAVWLALVLWGITGMAMALKPPFYHKGVSLILKDHVVQGKVDYAGIRRSRLPELKAYVGSLAEVNPDIFDKTDQIAFWLNAYNSIVILQICQGEAPTTSAARGDFFRRSTFLVAGQQRSLDDMEHRALRPLAKDPRVHFVLVCGANSCPPLRASAFAGSADLETALEEAARQYVNDPNNVTVDLAHKKLLVNRIFEWYQEDFGDVVKFVARYLGPQQRAQLLQGEWEVEYRDYDWSTNQAH